MKAPLRIASEDRSQNGLPRPGTSSRRHLVTRASVLMECDDRVIDFQTQPLVTRLADDGAEA